MTKLRLIGAAALVLSSALAGPAMAQQVMNHPGRCVQYDPAGQCMRFAASHRGDRAMRNGNWQLSRNVSRRDPGFWPGDVAAGVVGGAVATADAAVGTAGAIAAAPFNDSYAYDNSYDHGWNDWNHQTYAQRNGFVCTPGTWFKGEDGRRHLCQ
jgi:hypothetical protein